MDCLHHNLQENHGRTEPVAIIVYRVVFQNLEDASQQRDSSDGTLAQGNHPDQCGYCYVPCEVLLSSHSTGSDVWKSIPAGHLSSTAAETCPGDTDPFPLLLLTTQGFEGANTLSTPNS